MLFCFGLHREEGEGAKVVKVENLENPYKHQHNFDTRFRLSLNKLYGWSSVDYDRVVMLDADNLFLQNTDELFQCGQFLCCLYQPLHFPHRPLCVAGKFLHDQSFKNNTLLILSHLQTHPIILKTQKYISPWLLHLYPYVQILVNLINENATSNFFIDSKVV